MPYLIKIHEYFENIFGDNLEQKVMVGAEFFNFEGILVFMDSR